jgi:HK97 gp10 family phage protein
MPRPNNATALGNHVAGLKEAKAAFQALPEIVRERMLEATETTVREIARHAQAKISSSPSIQTRSLYNHIAWRVTKTNGRGRVGISTGSTTFTIGGKKVRVKGIVVAGRGGSAAKSAGAKVIRPSRYAHLVEFGSRKMGAEPFMIPAAEAEKQPYLQRCVHAGKAIELDVKAIGGRNL